jgi:hypothetical protein
MTAPTLSLHRKLAQVMYEAERIPKRGRAPAAMGGFEFVQVGDAADVIRKALAEHKVSMIPSAIDLVDSTEHTTSGGKSMTTVTVRTTWTLTDGDSGESAVIQSMGSGADTGDKAIPKAQSNAMKYALLMGFLLSTGDDPELTDSSDRQRRPAPVEPDALVQPTDGSLIGTAEVGKVGSGADFELRQSPEGPVCAFRLTQGRKGWKVIAHGEMAVSLAALRPEGQRVSVYGSMQDETFAKGGKDITFQVVNLERIKGDDFELPAPPEAPSEALFDEADLADVTA